ncbi:hypothetical protein NBO_422g0001 [Nosema bombycis CQ1]|uniref:Uncharacterized protein n=1 Tax=Nosema bombycis (strain CQ1 / CVCC 102059) TaxID=578461 RepID=R0MI81_NOSB1|nr:hypothetical protein NBO_422g0001 [Nosema bombycis CQ1]|eukprot:EOB12503.1 hypothetical protein NBO_422g0001 [Nosema bombycis CQ1]
MQSICNFVKLVEESAKPHKLKMKKKIKIFLAGLREEMPDVRSVIIRGKVIDFVLRIFIY